MMMSVYEILKRDIPRLEKKYGANSPYILQLKQQVADIEANPEEDDSEELDDTDDTELFHAMIVPNPGDGNPTSSPCQGIETKDGDASPAGVNEWDPGNPNRSHAME